MGAIIDGKAISKALRRELKEDVARFADETGVQPSLTVILVGDDPASHAYVRSKERACDRLGFISRTIRLPETATEAEVLGHIDALNADDTVHGLLVQLPLPEAINVEKVVQRISPLKDVDAFHPENLGLLFRGTPRFVPCTAAGIIDILDQLPMPLTGLQAVVIGRSLIVGKPVSQLLLARNLTVTVCHSRTRDLESHVRGADILVAAVGRAHFVRGEWVKPGAVVIDVGINEVEDGSLVGDVEFETAQARAAHITPVPGGVGQLTVPRLLANVLHAARIQQGLRPARPVR